MYIECEVLGVGLSIGEIWGSAAASAMDEAESSNANKKNQEQPQAMELQNYDAENEHQVWVRVSQVAERLNEIIVRDSRNFDTWSALIEEVEEKCPDNLDIISLAYDSFLSRFPLCHWYWRKYTDHIVQLSDAHKAIDVYERAVDSTTFSLGLWIDYCHFGVSFYKDPSDVRRLFKRALMFVRRDYFCHALWNQYIKYEFTQQHWGNLANVYLQVLRFPTEYLHKYYENFKQFVSGMEEEMRKHENFRMELEAVVLPNAAAKWSENEISQVIEDLQNPSNEALIPKAVHKYKFIGENFYQRAMDLDEKIQNFEANIQRRYYDAAPLDDEQLKNWHHYLDFIEEQKDFEWTLQLYERCLISCANYPEFWMRYVEFMESNGGLELANSALERATQVFLKDVPEIHLFNARFKERMRDANAALVMCDMGSDSYLPKHIVERSNMERRLGNPQAASDTLDRAINIAQKKQKLDEFSSLFIHSSRLKHMITGSADAARDVLIDGIRRLPHCKELLEELIKFAMTHGHKQVSLLDPIIAHAISPSCDGSQGLAVKDREYISSLFLEFVDLCGTVRHVRKAWNRHVKLFPQLLRINLLDKQQHSGSLLSDDILEQRESSSCAFPNLLARGHKCKQPDQEQASVLPVNHASKGELVCAHQTPQKRNDNVECEKRHQLSTQVANEPIVDELTNDFVLQFADDRPGVVESTENLRQPPIVDVPGLVEINRTLAHSSGEELSGLNGLTCNFNDQSRAIATLESSQEHVEKTTMQDQELEQHPKPVYFDNLSLNSQEEASQDLIAMASEEHDAALDISKSNGTMLPDCLNANTIPPITSPNSTPTADSVQEPLDGTKSASFLSSASHKKSGKTKMHSNSLVTPSNSGELRQMHRRTVPDGEASGMSLHSKDLLHQHQQRSTLHHNPNVALGSQIPKSQVYPQHPLDWKQGSQAQVHKEGVAQEIIATNPICPVNNVPDVSSSSTDQSHVSSPLVSCPQPNLLLHGSQGSLQPVTTHHSHTLCQTWQYNQHLQQPQYQQQLVEMLPQQQQQQQSFQQQQLQPQQQQNIQQQPSSWQQQLPSVPYQVQQQLIPYLQQAHQQLQQHYHLSTQQTQLQEGQQQQFLQVHEQQLQLYGQSEKLAYEMHQQGYQQHAAQAYQTLLQQYLLHQQGYGQLIQQHQHQYQYNQMVQQQQQLLHQPPLHQQQDDEQQEHHQQKASNQDVPQGISGHLQGQQNAPEGSDSAHVQLLSPRCMAQQNTESRPVPAVSSYNQLTSVKTSPSCDMDTAESAASSHHGK